MQGRLRRGGLAANITAGIVTTAAWRPYH